LAVGFGVSGHFSHHSQDALTAQTGSPLQQIGDAVRATPGIGDASTDIASAIAPTPVSATREAELDDGQTFADMLGDQGVTDEDSMAAMNAVAKVYDLRHMRAGQDVTLTFLRTDTKETLTGAVFQPEDTKEISLARAGDGSYSAHITTIPVTRHRVAAAGEIHTTLYEAGDRAGVSHALMASLIRVYSHSVDFQRDIHSGDRFEVLFDQSQTAKGKLVGDSTIVYARLTIDGKPHEMYRVTFNDNTADYFDEHGQTVRRALLRTPVAAAHITSGYGMRIHPLLGYSKMHKGVDFGAPIGTPIFAAGNGTIEEIGFKNGFGRYILIRHNGTYDTAYGHMSRFASNLYRGSHVNQGQVIAYVGMSGRATGPHLHFEVHVNGKQVNPMSVNAMPAGRTLDGKMLTAFKEGQKRLRGEFDALLSNKATMTPAAADSPAFTPRKIAAQ
jgi:murein DD-endopeptidase MepM/ murein hydrolase activator NlpD